MGTKTPEAPSGIISDRTFKYGVRLSLLLIAIGILQLLDWHWLRNSFNFLSDSITHLTKEATSNLSVCPGVKDVALSSSQPYVEQVQERDCLSGLVDLPPHTNFDYYFPGETEIYACDTRKCVKKLLVPDLNNKKNPDKIYDFPRTFRLKGKPGKASFKLVKQN